jgi:hypothetical protein
VGKWRSRALDFLFSTTILRCVLIALALLLLLTLAPRCCLPLLALALLLLPMPALRRCLPLLALRTICIAPIVVFTLLLLLLLSRRRSYFYCSRSFLLPSL